MKLIDIYNNYKVKYNNYVIIIKSGIFYNVYNEDTSIMYQVFHYKIKNTGTNYLVGFPISNINKVLDTLKYKKINYIVVENNLDNYEIVIKNKTSKNNYNIYLSDISKINYLESKINNLTNKLISRINDSDIFNILTEIESLL